MIDAQGYRANVAIVLFNRQGKIFWGKRVGQDSWQFPQGGVNEGETVLHALYRELREEIGLLPTDVRVHACTPNWLAYRIPPHLIRQSQPMCIGQRQKWFLLELINEEGLIRFDATETPEFDDWRWVSYWTPLDAVIDFKQTVYREALTYLAPYVGVDVGEPA